MMMITFEQVQQELEKKETKSTSFNKSIGIFIASLVLFFSLGLFNNSISGIVILVLVILIHELGHFIGMKWFKYKDVQMFFIPLFGAAVSGEETNPSGAKKAFVSLLGPVPGIILGIACGVMYVITREDILVEWTRTFLFINGFNLLPFYPLDGGRFFDYVLFSRHPKIELAFKIVTGICLGLMALLLQAPLLGIFCFFLLASLSMEYKMAKFAFGLRNDAPPETATQPSAHMPPDILSQTVDFLNTAIPEQQRKVPLFLTYIKHIWRRVQNRAPSIKATIGLTFLYAFFMVVVVLATFIFEMGMMLDRPRTEVVQRTTAENQTIRVERQYVLDSKYAEVPLDDNGAYHGVQTFWDVFVEEQPTEEPTKIDREGPWEHGYVHGAWKYRDDEGQVSEIIHYDRGRPVRYEKRVEGTLREIPEKEWPYYVRTQKEQKFSKEFKNVRP